MEPKKENHHLIAQRVLRAPDQLTPDTRFLVIWIDRQVGKIAAIDEIGHRPLPTNQPIAIPGAHNQIGILNHLTDARQLIDQLLESGTAVEHGDGFSRRIVAEGVG